MQWILVLAGSAGILEFSLSKNSSTNKPFSLCDDSRVLKGVSFSSDKTSTKF